MLKTTVLAVIFNKPAAKQVFNAKAPPVWRGCT